MRFDCHAVAQAVRERRARARRRHGYTRRVVSALNPTQAKDLVDDEGRPYFLWDVDMTLRAFRDALTQGDPEGRAYLLGKLMRQAKPDDVFQFVSRADLEAAWPKLERHLGTTRSMWRWLLDRWSESDRRDDR